MFTAISNRDSAISISGLSYSEWVPSISSWKEFSGLVKIQIMYCTKKEREEINSTEDHLKHIEAYSSSKFASQSNSENLIVVHPELFSSNIGEYILKIQIEKVNAVKLLRDGNVLTLAWQEDSENVVKSVAFKGADEFEVLVLETALSKFGFERFASLSSSSSHQIRDLTAKGAIPMTDHEIREILCDPGFEKVVSQVNIALTQLFNISNKF